MARPPSHHLILDQADDRRDNRASDATPYRLAGESADIEVGACARHHGE
jgi:hypothetical protein